MKNLLLIAFLLPASLWAFQKNTPGKPAGNTVSLSCRVYATRGGIDSMYLYEEMGLAKRIVGRAGKSGADSAFVFTVPAGAPRFYSVGANEQSTARVILGEEKQVTLWGNTQYMNKARTVNSAANKSMEALMARITAFNDESTQIRAQFNASTGTALRGMEERMAEFQQKKMKFLDSLKTANALLWRVASVYVTPDFAGQAGPEAEFYGKDYFKWVDWNDKAYEQIPDVYNAFSNFMYQQLQLNAPGDNNAKTVKMAEIQLARIPAGTPTHRMALGGIVTALKDNNSPQYPTYAKKYLELYRAKDYGEIGMLDMEVKKASTFLTGFEAPDLVGMTPDSSTFSLKQLRGKVVMIDFWASWCGPCRKENPNVVVNYNKYHSKGFDVLGVSLDREITAWRNAIKQDGLPWHHISDLKGWNSSHAALYSVSSIPQTVLVDKQGNIIARNLRGEQLGAKLKEIFGE